MTEMESPLEDYADRLGFHFDSYFIWRLLYRRVGDALTINVINLKSRICLFTPFWKRFLFFF